MRYFHAVLIFALFIFSCKSDKGGQMQPDPTPVTLAHEGLPTPFLPTDNPLTVEGIELGRMLFYEKDMSKDGKMSCATCHLQQNAFADTARFSIGVEGLPGKRQAMAVFNMAWNDFQFFWDGRANLLRDQSLMPIKDPLEMNESIDNVIAKLQTKRDYLKRFEAAFGSPEIDSVKISLALEQFMNSIVSNRSKYDKVLAGEASFSATEERGRKLFFAPFDPDNPTASGANCAVCHGGPNFENDSYMNNGLDALADMEDAGREKVTGNPLAKGAFKVPSLRNIELTFPYMHDGRFKTLEEVIEHYDNGVQYSPTLNPTLRSIQDNSGLMLDAGQKKDLIAFLKTLTDLELIDNPDYSDPF